jgi:hypothetical protein
MTGEACFGVAGGGYRAERRSGGLRGGEREDGCTGGKAGRDEAAGPRRALIDAIVEDYRAAVRAGAGALAGMRRPAMERS